MIRCAARFAGADTALTRCRLGGSAPVREPEVLRERAGEVGLADEADPAVVGAEVGQPARVVGRRRAPAAAEHELVLPRRELREVVVA